MKKTAILAAKSALRGRIRIPPDVTTDQQAAEYLLKVYSDQNGELRDLIRRVLALILEFKEAARALDPFEPEPPRVSNNNPPACPIMGIPIVTRCTAETCPLHLGSLAPENISSACIIEAAQGRALRVTEISRYSKGKTVNQVKKDLAGAMRVLRQRSVSLAQDNNTLPREFVFLRNSQICAHCEASTYRGDSGRVYLPAPLGEDHKPALVFCSKACARARPIALVLIEMRLGVPADKVLRWVRRTYRGADLTTVANALNVPSKFLSQVWDTI